ncbi:PTS sugar transporter subunit IIA [Actinomyces minihominis]|uniref:PTS sugar transporter subunit IIA n=1 Tax=Actinomyces minihominis TaxID=2002838 RepID=UPI00351FF0F2
MTAQGLFGPRDDVPLASPLRGIVVALENTPDAGFASGAVGAGAAIYPTENLVRSPGSGKVVMNFPTGHAVGLRLDSGLEVLIHIGIDTVQMNRTGFEVHVRKGDSVDLGTPLVSFNRDAIEAAGYSPITPVLVTNRRRFSAVDLVAGGPIDFGDELLVVEPKKPAAD